jgi:DNA-binding transcriptional MerR regulator
VEPTVDLPVDWKCKRGEGRGRGAVVDSEMRIGDLASRAGVNPKTVRYYEEIGLMPPPERRPSGHRLYGGEDLERMRFIRSAQRLGITLDDIREILALRERGSRPCAYVRDVLRREVADIEQRIADMARLRDELMELERAADELEGHAGSSTCSLIEHATVTAPGGAPGSLRHPRVSKASRAAAATTA